jgi:hypothetical protein
MLCKSATRYVRKGGAMRELLILCIVMTVMVAAIYIFFAQL